MSFFLCWPEGIRSSVRGEESEGAFKEGLEALIGLFEDLRSHDGSNSRDPGKGWP